MESAIKKYQPDRQDILWNTDWGILEKEISEEEAKERGLVLYKGRWVGQSERGILSSQLLGYHGIILVAILYLFFGWAGIIIGIFEPVVDGLQVVLSGNGSGVVEVLVKFVTAVPAVLLGAAAIMVGRGLRGFKRWALYFVRVFIGVVIGLAAISKVMALSGLYEPRGAYNSLAGLFIIVLFAVPHAMLFTAMTRNIFLGKNQGLTPSATDESAPPAPANDPPPQSDVKAPPRTKINAKAVVQDIRGGMDDVSLMQKYGLSARQLKMLYKKLEETGLTNKA